MILIYVEEDCDCKLALFYVLNREDIAFRSRDHRYVIYVIPACRIYLYLFVYFIDISCH